MSSLIPGTHFIRNFVAIGVMGLLVACGGGGGGGGSIGSIDPCLSLPVIPCAAGFGITTPAGRGGTVYKVTNLSATGSGSLRACIDQSGPRVCVFEVSGTITLTEDLSISNPFLTIAGQTAPSPGITIRGAGLDIGTHDVLVQHLRIRVGDDPSGPNPENRDAIRVESGSDNIVIDHCSLSWAVDETISAFTSWDDVTWRHNIFSEALSNSIHPSGEHSKGPFAGPWDGHISMIGNLLAHNQERNPLTRGGKFVFVNNVNYNRGDKDIQLQGENGIVTHNSIVGNVFIRGPNFDFVSNNKPIFIRGGSLEVPLGSKVYVADNAAVEFVNDPWDLVQNESSQSRAALQVFSPPTWPAGLVAKSTANNQVLDWVLANAGARPADRDSVDARIVNDVRNGTGSIIDSQDDVGGWPNPAENTRILTLPANPNGDDDGDGYTNLEEWLHAFAAEVE